MADTLGPDIVATTDRDHLYAAGFDLAKRLRRGQRKPRRENSPPVDHVPPSSEIRGVQKSSRRKDGLAFVRVQRSGCERHPARTEQRLELLHQFVLTGALAVVDGHNEI